jgi:hypothetical protein
LFDDTMIYRCMECGNEIEYADVPEVADGCGTKGRVVFHLSPVCPHELPYHMSFVPKSEPNKPRHPKRKPKEVSNA